VGVREGKWSLYCCLMPAITWRKLSPPATGAGLSRVFRGSVVAKLSCGIPASVEDPVERVHGASLSKPALTLENRRPPGTGLTRLVVGPSPS
jgi:hypothetical protein